MENFTSPNPFASQPTVSRRAPNFMAKVFVSFAGALLISALGTYVAFQYFSLFIVENPMTIWGIFAIELILVLTSRLWSTLYPLNYAFFAVFAFVSGVTLMPLLAGTMLEFGGPVILVKAFVATTLVFTSAAVVAWITQRNLTGLRGFLMISLIGMIVVSLIGLFVPWSNTFEMLFSGFGIGLFTLYTMYDVQRLKEYPENRYIDAALQLYLDIFNLFIYILRLIGGLSRR